MSPTGSRRAWPRVSGRISRQRCFRCSSGTPAVLDSLASSCPPGRPAAPIVLNRAYTPSAQHRIGNAPGQILSTLPERKVVHQTQLEIVRDVVIADGFLQTAVVLIGRARIIRNP